ncbi:MAG TPA: hypothetical protein DEQ03_15880 [Marinilabiliales bacterium]|nr:hypothetical protein [Marinilabiliales bacterium]
MKPAVIGNIFIGVFLLLAAILFLIKFWGWGNYGGPFPVVLFTLIFLFFAMAFFREARKEHKRCSKGD